MYQHTHHIHSFLLLYFIVDDPTLLSSMNSFCARYYCKGIETIVMYKIIFQEKYDILLCNTTPPCAIVIVASKFLSFFITNNRGKNYRNLLSFRKIFRSDFFYVRAFCCNVYWSNPLITIPNIKHTKKIL